MSKYSNPMNITLFNVKKFPLRVIEFYVGFLLLCYMNQSLEYCQPILLFYYFFILVLFFSVKLWVAPDWSYVVTVSHPSELGMNVEVLPVFFFCQIKLIHSDKYLTPWLSHLKFAFSPQKFTNSKIYITFDIFFLYLIW